MSSKSKNDRVRRGQGQTDAREPKERRTSWKSKRRWDERLAVASLLKQGRDGVSKAQTFEANESISDAEIAKRLARSPKMVDAMAVVFKTGTRAGTSTEKRMKYSTKKVNALLKERGWKNGLGGYSSCSLASTQKWANAEDRENDIVSIFFGFFTTFVAENASEPKSREDAKVLTRFGERVLRVAITQTAADGRGEVDAESASTISRRVADVHERLKSAGVWAPCFEPFEPSKILKRALAPPETSEPQENTVSLEVGGVAEARAGTSSRVFEFGETASDVVADLLASEERVDGRSPQWTIVAVMVGELWATHPGFPICRDALSWLAARMAKASGVSVSNGTIAKGFGDLGRDGDPFFSKQGHTVVPNGLSSIDSVVGMAELLRARFAEKRGKNRRDG